MDTLSAGTTSLREKVPEEIAPAVGSRGPLPDDQLRAKYLISFERNG
jgi:hypothetical protein